MSPSAMLQGCQRPGGCPEIQAGRFCDKHKPATAPALRWGRARGTRASDGYGSRWTGFSRRFRERYPICGMRPPEAPPTNDSLCVRDGRVSASQMTDHVVPVSGPKDPLFYARGNHQALCHHCHAVKRQRESRGGRA